jgi:phage protein D
MLTPAYKLTIADTIIDTTDKPQASTMVELLVALDLDTPADSFTLVLGQVGGVKPNRDDEVKLELGYADNGSLTQVMVGTVATIVANLTSTKVFGFSATTALLNTYVDQTYESKPAGAIVRDLAETASLDVAAADDGITFPAYVVDSRRSAYYHMQDLAMLCGVDLYIDTDGKLVFEKFSSGKTVHIFEYAKQIISLDALLTPPLAGMVQVWGEGPAGSRGDNAWAWLTTDFSSSKGTAGSGARQLLERPEIRSAEAASTAANAALTTIQRRTQRGQLLATGHPEVKLGDAIQLRGLPNDALNKNFQVRSVTHRITKQKGFTTEIGFRAIQV